ncbi:sce7726 family protein [Bacillus cereus]|nr:sce7726 family protein [Bacillus cereus]
MLKLKDSDIRNVLLNELRNQYKNDEAIVVNEMGVCQGKSRVDIAVVNGIIHGYEIKSESDTLKRLPRQMEDYNRVFDRMTIVVASKYLDEVRELIPKWWGIILVRNKQGEAKLKMVRKGRKNKEIDPISLAQLLWKEEALEILKEKGLHRGFLSKPKKEILRHLSESIELEELQSRINWILKNRSEWRDFELQVPNGDSHY